MKTLRLSIMTLLVLATSSLSLIAPARVLAAAVTDCNGSFLGIPAWHAYLQKSPAPDCTLLNDSSEPIQGINDIGSVLPKVLVALLDALLRIAGIVAFAFVVLSGFRFVFAQGNSDKEKQARTALFNAVIGMLIATSAAFVVAFIGRRLS